LGELLSLRQRDDTQSFLVGVVEESKGRYPDLVVDAQFAKRYGRILL